MTSKCLETVKFSSDHIGNVIQAIGSSKTHGHDSISIRMLKIYRNSICKPLEIIFKNWINVGVSFFYCGKG